MGDQRQASLTVPTISRPAFRRKSVTLPALPSGTRGASAVSPLANAVDDWRNLEDKSQRRILQNRIAQRGYRYRKKQDLFERGIDARVTKTELKAANRIAAKTSRTQRALSVPRMMTELDSNIETMPPPLPPIVPITHLPTALTASVDPFQTVNRVHTWPNEAPVSASYETQEFNELTPTIKTEFDEQTPTIKTEFRDPFDAHSSYHMTQPIPQTRFADYPAFPERQNASMARFNSESVEAVADHMVYDRSARSMSVASWISLPDYVEYEDDMTGQMSAPLLQNTQSSYLYSRYPDQRWDPRQVMPYTPMPENVYNNPSAYWRT